MALLPISARPNSRSRPRRRAYSKSHICPLIVLSCAISSKSRRLLLSTPCQRYSICCESNVLSSSVSGSRSSFNAAIVSLSHSSFIGIGIGLVMFKSVFKRILATSDLHLSDTIWKHRPIHGDSYHSWSYIVDYAVTNEMDAVILAGDILDKQLNVATPVAKLNEGLRRLQANGIVVLYNQGQHEFQRQTPWMDVASLGAVHLNLNSDFRTANGFRIAGFDYCNEKTLAENLGEIAKDSTQSYFLVCHQVWKNFMGDVGKSQGCFDDLPANVRCMLTGDFHQTVVQTRDDGLTVLSPGSTHLRSLAEPADKYFFELTFDKSEFTCQKRLIPTRGYFCFSVKSNPDYKQISKEIKECLKTDYSHLPEELRKPILRVIHGADDFDFVRYVKQNFDDKAHLFFKLKHIAAEPLDVDVTADESKLTLQACLPDEIDPEGAPKAYALASSLLSGGDPETILEKWLEENLDAD